MERKIYPLGWSLYFLLLFAPNRSIDLTKVVKNGQIESEGGQAFINCLTGQACLTLYDKVGHGSNTYINDAKDLDGFELFASEDAHIVKLIDSALQKGADN